MGCDIHIFTQRKNNSGKWVSADFFVKNDYYDPESEDYDSKNEYELIQIYGHRNYTVFGILADVRNYKGGFLGTERYAQPISEPKGLPDDLDDYLKSYFDEWAGDIHSMSYLTLKEIKEYAVKSRGNIRMGFIESEFNNDENVFFDIETLKDSPNNRYDFLKENFYKHNILGELIDLMEQRFKSFHRYERDDNNFRIVFGFDN